MKPIDRDQLIAELRAMKPTLKEMNIVRLSLYGSVARGDHKVDSDVDLLVDFSKPVDLITFASVQRKLSEALGRQVDLGMRQAIRKPHQMHILDEAIDV